MFKNLLDPDIQTPKINIEEIPDVSLSDHLQLTLTNLFKDEEEGYVHLTDTTSVVQTDKNYVFFSNQWYYLAALAKNYALALFEYGQFFDQKIRPNRDILPKSGGFNSESDAFISLFNGNEDCQRMKKFIAGGDNNAFRPGKNMVNQNNIRSCIDIIGSCVLKKLPVPDSSSSYLGHMIYYLAERPALYEELCQELLNKPLSQSAATSATASVNRVNGGQNLLVYGAPGTGKSHYLENHFPAEQTTRIVFHAEYSYFDFVGSYRPSPVYAQSEQDFHTVDGQTFSQGEPFIDYTFVPGPFTEVFIKAWQDPSKMYYLLIEELNRADAASVFGDIFQLLDRRDNGESVFGIRPQKDLRNYLLSQGLASCFDDAGQIRIPSNMTLLATMNSADQGVNVLDTAFKRRWQYMFRPIQYDVTDEKTGENLLGIPVTYAGAPHAWNDIIHRINDRLNQLYQVGEDRLIGPFFVSPDLMDRTDPSATGNMDAMKKVLFYLWDDVLRHESRSRMFGTYHTMAELYRDFPQKDVMSLYQDTISKDGESSSVQGYDMAEETADETVNMDEHDE
jgi:hypothetical protein